MLSHNMREIRVRFPLILDMNDVEEGTIDVDRVKLARAEERVLTVIGRTPSAD